MVRTVLNFFCALPDAIANFFDTTPVLFLLVLACVLRPFVAPFFKAAGRQDTTGALTGLFLIAYLTRRYLDAPSHDTFTLLAVAIRPVVAVPIVHTSVTLFFNVVARLELALVRVSRKVRATLILPRFQFSDRNYSHIEQAIPAAAPETPPTMPVSQSHPNDEQLRHVADARAVFQQAWAAAQEQPDESKRRVALYKAKHEFAQRLAQIFDLT